MSAFFGQGYLRSSPVLTGPEAGHGSRVRGVDANEIGRLMEKVTREVYELATDRRVVPAEPYELHAFAPDHPGSVPRSTPSTLFSGRPAGAEPRRLHERERHPRPLVPQCQTQLLVTKRERIRLVILLRGCDLKIFDLTPNTEVQAEIVKRSRDFMDALEAKRTPSSGVP